MISVTLTGVNIREANFTQANLRGASDIRQTIHPHLAIWSNTTCPDGYASNYLLPETCNRVPLAVGLRRVAVAGGVALGGVLLGLVGVTGLVWGVKRFGRR